MRFLLVTALMLWPGVAIAQNRDAPVADDFRRTLECPRRRFCTQVSSCREAVHLWCVCGYRNADRDGDGVPCESLCGQSDPMTLERVSRIRRDLGCGR